MPTLHQQHKATQLDAVLHRIKGRPKHPGMISISIGLVPNPIAATRNVPKFTNPLFQHTVGTLDQGFDPSNHQFLNL